jgi:protoporphyrinogen IX oxidase
MANTTLINFLLWAHFLGIGMSVGGGVALARVGPALIAAPSDQRELLWSFEIFFSRVGAAGLLLLLVTGPLMLWLKFGGPSGLGGWFAAKMAFVAIAVVGVSVHEWAGRRFRTGNASSTRLMFIGGRAAGMGIVLAMLCAAFTFG